MNGDFVRTTMLSFSKRCPRDVLISLRITRAQSYFRFLWDEVSGCGLLCL